MVVAKDKRSPGGSPFGRIPRLTAQIKELIHDYPEGIGIVKELAQNADDAGARVLEIVIDHRHHPAEQLPAAAMAVLQGPALLFFNDKIFTDDDFDRIQEIYRSGKIRAADKTGQFGKGFNTVYNVTDCPSLVTGDRVAFFDPHCSIVPGANRTNPGRYWTLAECWDEYPDLLTPFSAVGLDAGTSFFNGTVFRLPFRTAAQALRSEICHTPYGDDNLRGLITELAEVRESLLIFLKRLEALRLREILVSGEERERITIKTVNVEEVRQKRQELLGLLDGDALAVVDRLRGRGTLLVPYEHCFTSTTFDEDSEELVPQGSTWRVVHCLSLDSDGKIAEAVESMLSADVKAVPLGGAAARLAQEHVEDEPAPLRGKVYCSLPLPIETGLPVHLNGFFDLDSSRHALTTDTGLTGRAKIRARWNQLLVEHVVAPAFADLIDWLGHDVGDNDPSHYYACWPRPARSFPKPLDTLTNAVYRRLAPLSVIRIRGTDRWAPVGKVTQLPDGWEILEAPLAADCWPLPDPPLSGEIVAGFQQAGFSVQTVSPPSVRNRLRQVQRIGPPGVPIVQAARECLRRRPWLEALLCFCLSDEPADLTDLPLALMANGRLRSFIVDPSHPIFVAGKEERALFAGQPHWFLDPRYAEECGLDTAPVPTGVSWMTLAEVLRCLPALLPKDRDIQLHPDGPEAPFPTVNWLTALYRYLLKAVRAGQQWSEDSLRKIPLVPDQTGALYCGGSACTPLLGTEEEMHELGGVLAALHAPLIVASPALREAISAFAGAVANFVWKLTGPDLIDSLACLDADNFPSYRRDIHPLLLNYLANPRWTKEAYSSSPKRLSDLQRLPIYPTVDGSVVNLEGNVLTPGNFDPPACIQSVTLLQTGPANSWLPLLTAAGVEPLSRAPFIDRYLLPEYDGMEPGDKLTALRWLRDNLNRAESELEEQEDDADQLLEAVCQAPLVKCEDGEFRPATKVYDPESDLIRELFGDSVAYPDRTYYSRGWDRWLEFFRRLRLVQTPGAQDLLDHIDRLCEEAASGLNVRLTASLLKAFDHVEEHWTAIAREEVEDVLGKDLASALRQRAWLPAETSGRGLRRWPGAVAPEARLYRPDELYLATHGNLVASQCPVFSKARVKADVHRALGFQSTVPLESALLHFEHLLHLWKSPRRPHRESFEGALDDIYRFLAAHAKDPHAAAAIRGRFAGIECLWHRGRLWLPEHAFRAKVPFFGDRRVTMPIREAPVRAAYQLLGMRDKPALPDYLAYLEELVDAFGDQPLPAADVDRLLEVYRRIGEEVRQEGLVDDRFPLLTQEGVLVDPEDAFYADAPWFDGRITHAAVRYLHRALPVSVSQLPWVRSLARDIREQPSGDWMLVDTPDVQRRTADIDALIQSPQFQHGIARLIYHEHGIFQLPIVRWLARARVVAVSELMSELILSLDGEDTVVGSGPSDHYLDEDCCIFIDDNAGRLMRQFVAQAINGGLTEHRLRDLSPLAAILDCRPAEIDYTLTRLRIKPVDDDSAFVPPDIDEGEPVDDGQGDDTQDDIAAAGDADRASTVEEESGSQSHNDAESSPVPATPSARQQSAQPAGQRARPSVSFAAAANRTGLAPADDSSTEGVQGQGSAGGGRAAAAARGDGDGARQSTGQVRGSGRPADGPRQSRGESSEAGASGSHPRSERPDQAGRSTGHPSSASEVRMRQRRDRRRRERRQRGQNRFVTYVSFGSQGGTTDAAPTLPDEERRERITLGDAAADIVCRFEHEHERLPTKLPHNHPGWDVDSLDVRRVESEAATGAPSRMIEVKGIRGPWTRQGVALSRRQFEAAQQYGDRYWLYVVEFADDPARARVHPIHNPFAKTNQFFFDNGWRQVADPTEAPSASCRLAVGQRITVDNVGEGVIEQIEQRGALKVVHLLLDGGTRVRRPYNPATMRPATQ